MKQYLKISNHGTKVNRLALEKLGLSTKRDDSRTIGQFGSGIKYAPIAAIRMGLEWYFTGEDDQGKYTLKYDVRNEGGVDCIVYNYGDYVKDSSFTAEAGIYSWENEFQLYREAVCNAIDEDVSNGNYWSMEVVDADQLSTFENEFSIFISFSPKIEHIYRNHDKYFCLDRIPVYQKTEAFALYEPYDRTSGLNVYHKGVNVFSHDRMPSLYDYEIGYISLNEQRTVSSHGIMNYRIMQSVSSCTNPSVINRFFSASEVREDVYEFVEIPSHDYYIGSQSESISEAWRKAWGSRYGEKSICISQADSSRSRIVNRLKIIGYNLIEHEDFVFNICKSHGIPTIDTVIDDNIKYDIDPNISNYPLLVKAIDIVSKYIPSIQELPGGINVFDSENAKDVLGLYVKATEQILIDKNHALEASIESIIATIIHEYDHHTSGCLDASDVDGRAFRNVADEHIGKLVYSLYGGTMNIKVEQQSVQIPISSVERIGNVNYSIKSLGSKTIMTVGNKVFSLDGDNIKSKSGVAKTSKDGEHMVINVPNVVSIKELD